MFPWVFPRVTRLRTWGPALAVVGLLDPARRCGAAKRNLPPATGARTCRCWSSSSSSRSSCDDQFNEYVVRKVPTRPPDFKGDGTGLDYMRATIIAAFNAYLHSPAGGGGGSGQAELGTDFDNCKLVFYVKGKDGKNVIDPKTKKEKTVPFNEDEYRSKNCKPIADYLLAHENQHVADCKSDPKDLSAWQNYAAYDVRAYAAGIKNLRSTDRQAGQGVPLAGVEQEHEANGRRRGGRRGSHARRDQEAGQGGEEEGRSQVSAAILVMSLVLGQTLYGIPPDEEDTADYDRPLRVELWRGEHAGVQAAPVAAGGPALPGGAGLPELHREGCRPGSGDGRTGRRLAASSRLWGIQAVRSPASPEAVALMVEALDDPYPRVREAALNALRNVDPKYAKYSDRSVQSDGPTRLPAGRCGPDRGAARGPVYPGREVPGLRQQRQVRPLHHPGSGGQGPRLLRHREPQGADRRGDEGRCAEEGAGDERPPGDDGADAAGPGAGQGHHHHDAGAAEGGRRRDGADELTRASRGWWDRST